MGLLQMMTTTKATTRPTESSSSTRRNKTSMHSSEHQPKRQKQEEDHIFGFYTKLGALATCALSLGLALILGSLAFLWFLWLADDSNHMWRAIADRDWFTRAVALFSLTIRQSASFQSAAATAMIASIAMERLIVLLLNLASVSTTRNANGGPYMLFWWLWKAFFFNPNRRQTILWPLVISILTITTALVQLTSFALLSDLEIAVVQASKTNQTDPTHFQYDSYGAIPVITHGSTWSQQLPSYVSFAEYHEPPSDHLPDGVIDTGLTFRAFLPVVDQQSRSMISSWDGIATVLDARTVCARPKLLQPRVHYSDRSLALETGFILDIDDPLALGLQSISNVYADPNCQNDDAICTESTACMIPLAALGDTGAVDEDKTTFSQWRLVTCQPSGFKDGTLYVLQSQFQTPGKEARETSYPNYSFGNAYLVVNVSSGSNTDWAQAIPSEDPNLGIFRGSGTRPVGFSVHGQHNEWYDLIFSEDANLNLSVSVCYTAFDTADLHVSIDSSSNHSDMSPTWNIKSAAYEYAKVRAQLGQELNGSVTYSTDLKARNVMNLKKRESWIPEPDFGDYVVPSNRVTQTSWITDYANMAGSLQSNVFHYEPGSNQTRFLWRGFQLTGLWNAQMSYDYADASLTGLVQEIVQSGGHLAFAMQSIVTSLTQLAYYQQLQQLNGVSSVVSSSYKLSSAPVRKRGLVAVTIVLGVHILVVFGVILPAFLLGTRISTLGNAWQAVAQLIDPKTKPILDKAPLGTEEDAEMEAKVPTGRKNKMKNRELVGLRCVDGQVVRIVNGSDSAQDAVNRTEEQNVVTANDVDDAGGAHDVPEVDNAEDYLHEQPHRQQEREELLRQRDMGRYHE